MCASGLWFTRAEVDQNVYDSRNRLIISRASDVELMVRNLGKHTLSLDAIAFK